MSLGLIIAGAASARIVQASHAHTRTHACAHHTHTKRAAKLPLAKFGPLFSGVLKCYLFILTVVNKNADARYCKPTIIANLK